MFLLIFTTNSLSEDISEFQIEGISIGESLLNYMSEKEIKDQINSNKYMYSFLTDDFGEVYLYNNFKTYDHLSFFVKSKDKEYLIFSISGSILYDDNIDQCIKKQNEIVKELSDLYKYVERDEGSVILRIDPSGKSKVHYIAFYFETGDSIRVDCNEYEKKIKNKNNWADALSVMIVKKDVFDWFN